MEVRYIVLICIVCFVHVSVANTVELDGCSISRGFYPCDDESACLETKFVCDNMTQCGDHSDEGGKCTEQNCSKSCEVCLPTPKGAVCSCEKGYELSEDGINCTDIDECSSYVQVCDHYCNNSEGSYNCTCAPGYSLNSGACTIEESAKFIYSTGYQIKIRDFDKNFSEVLYSGSEIIDKVAYDPKLNVLYWIEHKRIWFKSDEEQEEPIIFLEKELRKPENIAIDWYGRNIYITDSEFNHILVCRLDTIDCLPILTNLSEPRALQLDLEQGYVFWSSMRSKFISRANLDGTNIKDIVQEGITWPNGLAIDFPVSRIYWIDDRATFFDSTDYDGLKRRELAYAESAHPNTLALWESRIYWTDWTTSLKKSIQSCQKRDGKKRRTEFTETYPINSLIISHPSLYNAAETRCTALQDSCSHLCLVSKMKNHKCACPQEMQLASDGITCLENSSDRLLLSVKSKLHVVYLRKYGKPKLSRLHSNNATSVIHNLQIVSDMDYDPKNLTTYFAEAQRGRIFKLDSSNVFTLILDGLKQPMAIAVDWLRENVYWVNGFHHNIEVVSMNGKFKKIAFYHFKNPVDIAVDAMRGDIYVCDSGLLPALWKCNISGDSVSNDCVHLFSETLKRPYAIFLDESVEPHVLYWIDYEKGSIESIETTGNNHLNLINDLRDPVKIYVDSKNILWTERNSPYLNVLPKEWTADEYVRKVEIPVEDYAHEEWAIIILGINEEKAANFSEIKNPCSGSTCGEFCFTKNFGDDQVCGCSESRKLLEDKKSCVRQRCHSFEKECDDGDCLPTLFWCDGEYDCLDGSDEKHCTVDRECLDTEYMCQTGSCIFFSDVCDGFDDCADGYDELNCTIVRILCHLDEFECKSGQCVPGHAKCDGQSQCADSSDELGCPVVVCDKEKRKCKSGKCLPKKWWCDGTADCSDGDDEEDCPCKPGEVKCANGRCLLESKICVGRGFCDDDIARNFLREDKHGRLTIKREKTEQQIRELGVNCSVVEKESYCPIDYLPCDEDNEDTQCIATSHWCNGEIDCENEADEKKCDFQCLHNYIKCEKENVCIKKSWRCDSVMDCPRFGSDESEENCGSYITDYERDFHFGDRSCKADEFSCGPWSCIVLEKVCNGKTDCEYGTDEKGNCDFCENDNGGCSHICVPHPVKSYCKCKPGFDLNSDRYTCQDIDECEDPEACEHTCVNTKGSYICTCNDGYTLHNDQSSCKPTEGLRWEILAMQKNVFTTFYDNFDKRKHMFVPTAMRQVTDSWKIFCDEEESVEAAGIVVVDPETGVLYKDSPFMPWALDQLPIRGISATALDFVTKNVYLAKPVYFHRVEENMTAKLLKSHMLVYNIKSQRTGQLNDIYNRKIVSMKIFGRLMEIFSCEIIEKFIGEKLSVESYTITARTMQGELLRDIVNKKIAQCDSIAIDEPKERVYWIDGAQNKIESADMLGYGRQTFLSNKLYRPQGLVVVHHNLLWYNLGSSNVVMCSIRDYDQCILRKMDHPTIFTAIKPVYEKYNTSCSHKPCDQVCIQLTKSVHACTCEPGFTYNTTCIRSSTSPLALEDKELDGYCKENSCHSGSCVQLSPKGFKCECFKGYTGRYCETYVITTETSVNAPIGAILLIAFIVVVTVFCFIFCFNRNRCRSFRNRGPFHNLNAYFSFARLRELDDDEENSNTPSPLVIFNRRHFQLNDSPKESTDEIISIDETEEIQGQNSADMNRASIRRGLISSSKKVSIHPLSPL